MHTLEALLRDMQNMLKRENKQLCTVTSGSYGFFISLKETEANNNMPLTAQSKLLVYSYFAFASLGKSLRTVVYGTELNSEQKGSLVSSIHRLTCFLGFPLHFFPLFYTSLQFTVISSIFLKKTNGYRKSQTGFENQTITE